MTTGTAPAPAAHTAAGREGGCSGLGGAHGLSKKREDSPPTFSETAPAVIPAQPGSLRTPRSGRASASILITLSKMKNSNRLFFSPLCSPSLLFPCPLFADKQMRRPGEELGLGAGGRAVPGPSERVPLSSPPSQRPLSCLYGAFVSCLSGKSKSRQKRETTPLHKHPNRHPRSSQPCAKIPRLGRWVKRRSC